MDFQARVIQFIGETSGVSKAGNPWKKKEWLVETFDQYPKKIRVQCFGDRAEAMNLENGKDYRLFVDIESREFNGRWYTDVSVYRADENMQGQGGMNASQPGMGYQTPQQPGGFANAPYNMPQAQGGASFSVEAVEESDEDLPF